jgi:t-SNARE complex subunit (syntaxin)
MVKDRLLDLKLAQRSSSSYSAHGAVCVDFSTASSEICQFLGKVERIQSDIEVISTTVDEIKRLGGIMLLLPGGSGQSITEVEERKGVVCRTISKVHSQIKEIEKLVEEDKGVPVDNLSTLARIQRIQHMMLLWMFAKAVSDYNEVLLKHQEKCRALMRQQMIIINKEDTSEELENLLEKDGAALFVDNIVADTLEAQLALASVKARHEEILKVENSIREIRNIFVQLAILVETQGDSINRIEFHVTKSGGYTDQGATKLQKKRKMKRKRRKISCICIVALVIIIGIIIILLIISS